MLEAFAGLSTPLVADAACAVVSRCGLPLRGSGRWWPASGSPGGVLLARHYGSVDVFLEALGRAGAGDVLVIDNGGRTDEAGVGDLAVLEARAAG